jgi:hypothetical protein
MAALLQEAQRRNFERWPILGRPVNPNYFVGSTYEEEVSWMKKFIQTRLDWMEKQFLAVPRLSLADGKGGSSTVELRSPGGEVYFTTDGSDPRASGGAVSSSARLYEGPIKLSKGTKIFARTRLDNRWSGPFRMTGDQ